jgi:hypothetical protein
MIIEVKYNQFKNMQLEQKKREKINFKKEGRRLEKAYENFVTALKTKYLSY